MRETKFMFVTGGVCSSLGKGIVASSVAAILKTAGIRASIMKLDPYLNVDPGTMSPFQHGEVFVLDDGAETDLDLGHYERFIDENLQQCCTITSGKIYSEVLEEERRGDHLGGTIQVVPHITNKIREKIESAAKKMKTDILVIEIGGTVGDIEGEPFIEVVRQMKHTYQQDCILLHTTLLPFLAASGELKTKPTQLSVRELKRTGVSPDFIFCRSDVPIPQKILKKISYFCDIPLENVIPAETIQSIYEVPLRFQRYQLGENIIKRFDINAGKVNMKAWEQGVDKILNAKKEIIIGIAGKYNDLDDAYISVIEATKSAGFWYDHKVKIEWINPEAIEENNKKELTKLSEVQGIIVPGGFGERGIEGKITVAKFCRENKVPYLGLCLGSQIMAIEFARNVLGIADATSEEFSEKGSHIVHFIPSQKNIRKKGGTMRLGSYPCKVKKGTKTYECYQHEKIHERHRHRYEFNNNFRENFEKNGFCIAGTFSESNLVEIVEIEDHPFMIGSQFHPELQSRPFMPHPLFRGFMAAVLG